MLGDRGYAVIDKESGKIASAKSVKLFPNLLMCSSSYLEPPQRGKEVPPVQITLADGQTINSDSKNIDKALSDFFGREVTLARVAPEDFTIDQFHPDIENLDPVGHRNMSTEEKIGSAYFRANGVDSPLSPGSFKDLFPVSVITTSTLEKLHELQPKTDFNIRRFRMNIVINTDANGFVENDWEGETITIANGVSLKIAIPDPRCVMTTLAQEGISKDNEVLKTLVNHNRPDINDSGKFPCAGIYAMVGKSGLVRINNNVERT